MDPTQTQANSWSDLITGLASDYTQIATSRSQITPAAGATTVSTSTASGKGNTALYAGMAIGGVLLLGVLLIALKK